MFFGRLITRYIDMTHKKNKIKDFSIVKHWHHCYDGTGWFQCSYWTKDSNGDHYCELFKKCKDKSKDTPECSNIFGSDYIGTFTEKDLIDYYSGNYKSNYIELRKFVEDILGRYNATPDEWDAYNSIIGED